MAGSEPGPVVAVEILVEQNQIAPVRIFLELRACRHRLAVGRLVAQEDAGQPARNLLGHFEQGHLPAGTGRAFHLEVVAVEGYRFSRPGRSGR